MFARRAALAVAATCSLVGGGVGGTGLGPGSGPGPLPLHNSSSLFIVPGPTSPNCSKPRWWLLLKDRTAAAVAPPYTPSAPRGPTFSPAAISAVWTFITLGPRSLIRRRSLLFRHASSLVSP